MENEALTLADITHHYSILGAPLWASKDDLRRARNKLLHRFHPDRAQDESSKQAYVVQSAYLYITENYDEIRKILKFIDEASLSNRMPLKSRSHWIYTTVATINDKKEIDEL